MFRFEYAGLRFHYLCGKRRRTIFRLIYHFASLIELFYAHYYITIQFINGFPNIIESPSNRIDWIYTNTNVTYNWFNSTVKHATITVKNNYYYRRKWLLLESQLGRCYRILKSPNPGEAYRMTILLFLAFVSSSYE